MTTTISIENLRNHPKNIRKSYGDLKELTASIREKGVLQNLVVVPDPKNEGKYLVVAGNCRLRAAKKAGLTELECVVTEMSEQEQVLTMLVENMQRNGLSVAEEAAGIQMCLEDFGMKVAEVAKATGLSHSTIRSRRNIAKLDPGIVCEKTGEDRQITITDLNALSKVKDVEKRNEILNKARDSSNLLRMVKQAEEDEKYDKNFAKLSAIVEELGIPYTDEVGSDELYGNKWDTIKSFNLLSDIPDAIFDSEDGDVDIDGMLYVIQYKTLKIIRKAKRQKQELTEKELHERAIRKARRGIKALWKQMHGEMSTFANCLLSGEVPEADDINGVAESLWNVIVHTEYGVSGNAVISTLSGREYYMVTHEERTSLFEQMAQMPLYQQMLPVAIKGCEKIEICNYCGEYNEYVGAAASLLADCLGRFGFSFSEDEYNQVLDGTHELYIPPITATDNSADDVCVDDSEAQSAGGDWDTSEESYNTEDTVSNESEMSESFGDVEVADSDESSDEDDTDDDGFVTIDEEDYPTVFPRRIRKHIAMLQK